VVRLAINWDVSAEIIDGWKTPNLYGLLFVTGLVIGYFIIKRMFNKEGVKDDYLDKLVLYMVLATVVGARLGHVFFYGPYWGVDGYFSNPLSIFKIWEGGLASHGGAIAILIALLIYSRRVVKKPMIWILDRIAAPIAIAACFIRLGNLINHEIVGIPTNLPWAFSFSRFYNQELGGYDLTPRHPAQLYEAICYLLAFLILIFIYWKKRGYEKPGLVFGLFLVLVFGTRFCVEFIKIGQTARDSVLFLNTGQILSIPLVLAGVYILWKALKKKPESSQEM